MTKKKEECPSFILPLYEFIFRILRFSTLAYWLDFFLRPRGCYRPVIDHYIIANTLLSAFAALFILDISLLIFKILCGWGIYRTIEICILHPNYIIFDPYRNIRDKKPQSSLNYLRIIVLSIQNYIEIVFWFSVFYRNFSDHFYIDITRWGENIQDLTSPFKSLYMSVVTMTTLGYGEITPKDDGGIILVISQTIIGIFLIVVVIANWINLKKAPDRDNTIL